MNKIGLTGGIATGKSTVAWMFGELGLPVINADEIAHEVIAPHTSTWKQLFERYGKKILQKGDTINRDALADIIFHDLSERKFVESVIHPQVKEELVRKVAHLQKDNATHLIIEIPLLFESKMQEDMDSIIVVRCDLEQQIKRCQKKFDLTRGEAVIRIQTQIPLAKKIDKADYVIDTAGSKSETMIQVRRIYTALEKGELHPKK
ncbi:MAG: dephospho-CoA kinase [Pseudomonadota bacterium]